MINLTIPVYNEEDTLEEKIMKIDNYLSKKEFKDDVFIVIADNRSNDKTSEISSLLVENNHTNTIYHYTDIPGKGNAIRESWEQYSANQYWFMDLDLSTDLSHIDELYERLKTNDIIIGSRLDKESDVTRCLKREITSRGYNYLLRKIFKKEFSDAQCGFKGISNEIVQNIIPLTKNNHYFFDSELLLLAETNNYHIGEIPVKWIEDKNSNVKLYKAIPKFLKNIVEYKIRTLYNSNSTKVSTN